MPRTISIHFNLNYEQPELDFVDAPISTDLPIFIDPYALSVREDLWSLECNQAILTFFEAAIRCIREKDHARGRSLLNGLREPNETHFGLSRGKSQGRGVSGKQALNLYEQLRRSRAAKTGLFSELSDFDLFVAGIGHDKISDITTNIVRRQLIGYTQEQCRLHKIPMRNVASGRLWNSASARWEEEYVELPVVRGNRLILVPKASVRWSLSFSPEKYYNHFVLNYLQEENLRTSSPLIEVLKSGHRRVTKQSLKTRYPFSKEFLAEFSANHSGVLKRYKEQLGIPGEISDAELIDGFDERAFARALRDTLAQIQPGPDHATTYHHLMAGILEFMFYPDLIIPVLEFEILEGRKRIDIKFTNSARDGFFFRRRTDPGARAINVYVECKNYSHELGNEELDQMAGRFSPVRGRFGLIVARSFADRERFKKRCRDTAVDNRGFIIALVDEDVSLILELIAHGKREQISRFLEERYQELIA